MTQDRLFRVGVLAACLVTAMTEPAGAAPRAVIGSGPDFVYGTNALSGATAAVAASDLGSDVTQLVLTLSDVNAPEGTEFGAHLHVNPCGSAPSAAGGHYTHSGVQGDTLRRREVWLDFVVDANGNGRSVATRDWTPSNRADRSVVIHALGTDHETGVAGARLACIDLDA